MPCWRGAPHLLIQRLGRNFRWIVARNNGLKVHVGPRCSNPNYDAFGEIYIRCVHARLCVCQSTVMLPLFKTIFTPLKAKMVIPVMRWKMPTSKKVFILLPDLWIMQHSNWFLSYLAPKQWKIEGFFLSFSPLSLSLFKFLNVFEISYRCLIFVLGIIAYWAWSFFLFWGGCGRRGESVAEKGHVEKGSDREKARRAKQNNRLQSQSRFFLACEPAGEHSRKVVCAYCVAGAKNLNFYVICNW